MNVASPGTGKKVPRACDLPHRVHGLHGAGAAPDRVVDDHVIGPRPAQLPVGRPAADEPAGLRVIGAHRGAAESAHGPRVLVAVIAVHGPQSSRARKYLLRPGRTARPHKPFTSLGRSLRSELPDAG